MYKDIVLEGFVLVKSIYFKNSCFFCHKGRRIKSVTVRNVIRFLCAKQWILEYRNLILNGPFKEMNFEFYTPLLTIEQKGIFFYHDFGYSFPPFSSLLIKEGRRKEE